ncbi:MAG: hypothetical protein H0X40_16150 [Chthoniobacterales bacterium]|nr:hypothetical protein [Chthoniobacterales bacterium]
MLALLSLGACAKHDSVAEFNAEIDRRVDERIEAQHQAEEKEKLARRQAALEAREKALAAQESSFANMTASLPDQSGAIPAESAVATNAEPYSAGDNYSAPDSYSTYPNTGGQFYSEQPYGYDSSYDPYFASEPYFCSQGVPYLTIINQNTRIVNRRRLPFTAGGRGQRAFGSSGVPTRMPMTSRPVAMPHRPMPRGNTPTSNARPSRNLIAPQPVNRRAVSKVAPQYNR